MDAVKNVRFGSFDLIPSRGCLLRDQRPVSIEPRAFTLLCYLVGHRHRVVSRQELLTSTWTGEVVSEAVLASAVRAIRVAIGDTGHQQRFIRTVHRRGYQFVAAATVTSTTVAPAGVRQSPDRDPWSRDTIRLCSTADDTRIAWAATGAGPPLVKTANWLSQLDLERASPIFAHWFEGLTRGRRLIRYDERGSGLSDQCSRFTLDEWIEDLDAVVDAANLDRFPLLGVGQGGPLAVAYAALRPERISRLVLSAGYARGRLARAHGAVEQAEAILDLNLAVAGWQGQEDSYLRFLGAQYFGGSPPGRWDEFTSYQQQTVSPANGIRFLEAESRLDVSDLARQVTCPTLIVHSRDDPRVPVSQAKELAGLIPDSRLVVLDGRNHLLTADEPAWPRFLNEMYAFLAEEEPPAVGE
ncbi:alpha/beta fold hydrolase [Micromonospora carbonacea]|uniref:Transcriptional regulatory protein, C terminal n=1 Tax=Micromonospora carbonacea TaxID=47853 RepID=A0A1C4V9L3_9ACTN|nr:alpha/beta fold hydrolase [Micromonospora carbonacea]SCE80449.1 Transcriptional regulatory protein, C terminal [Micromonospora carbonacea]